MRSSFEGQLRSDLAIEQQACQTQIYGIYYPQLLHVQPSGLHMDDTQVYRSVLLDVTAGAESPNTVLSTPFRAAHTNEATEPLADSSLPSLNANRAEPTSRSKWNGVHLATSSTLHNMPTPAMRQLQTNNKQEKTDNQK